MQASSLLSSFPIREPFQKNSTEKESYYNISNCTIEREKEEIEAGFSGLGRIGRIDRKEKIYKNTTQFKGRRQKICKLHKPENMKTA